MNNTIENRKLLILGAGGHGRVVKETAEAMEFFDRIDFLDDAPNCKLAIGLCQDYRNYISKYQYAFPAIGNNELRIKWLGVLAAAGYSIPVLIHPTAYVSPSVTVSSGAFIAAKVAINSGAVVGSGVIISIRALVEHDSVIGEGCHIDCGAIVKGRVDRLQKVGAGVVIIGEGVVGEKVVKKHSKSMQEESVIPLRLVTSTAIENS